MDFSACTSSSASVNDLRRDREGFEGRGAQTRSGVAATRGEDGGREGYVLAPFLGLGRLTRELAASLLQRVVVGAQHADGGGVRGRAASWTCPCPRACGSARRGRPSRLRGGAGRLSRNGSGDVSFRETRGSRGTRRRVDGVPARAEGRDAHLSCAEWRCARRVDRRSVGRARASRGMRRARLDAPATKRRNGKMLSEGGNQRFGISFGSEEYTFRSSDPNLACVFFFRGHAVCDFSRGHIDAAPHREKRNCIDSLVASKVGTPAWRVRSGAPRTRRDVERHGFPD